MILLLIASACTSGGDDSGPKPIRPADDRCTSTEPSDHFYAENAAYEDTHVLDLPKGKAGASFDRRLLERTSAELARTSGAMSFLVMQNGKLVWERYFNGSRATHANNIHSASKAILSLSLGRAIADGKLALDDDVREHLPSELVPDGAPDLTVRDLVTMSGGLAWQENVTEERFDRQRSYVRQILELEQIAAPGASFAYNTGLTHLLSAVITGATGVSLCEYAHRALLTPIGVTVDHWHTDPDGFNAGGHSVFITPRELARIGQVVLDESENRLDGGPAGSWIKRSLARTWDLGCRGPSESVGYGYLWWRSNISDVKVWKAEGFAGQTMFIVPATQTVVVLTTDTHTAHPNPIDHTAIMNLLLDNPGGGGCAGFDLHRVNVDGSKLERVTFNASMDLWGAPSPDGERIAFHSTRYANWEIYVTDADRSADLAGKQPARLTADPRMDTFPAWAPDGERIAFSRDGDGDGGGIFTMDDTGHDVRRVTEGRDITPSWSPDGDRIAFARAASGPDDPGALMVVEADGGDAGPLGDDLRGAAPAWSVDGRRLAFFREDTVYTANADGTAVRRIAEGRHPRFLPDGSLVFGARGGRGGTWRIVRWRDGEVTTVVDTPEDDLLPLPSRDGR